MIGGGASGLMAAIAAAEEALSRQLNITIDVYEANDRVGKKILVTGNGRCNLSNSNISVDDYFGDTDLFEEVYPLFDRSASLSFFRSCGLCTCCDDAGRIYPSSKKSASVLDALLYECERTGIHMHVETKIERIQKTEDGYLLNGKMHADLVILAVGGKAGAAKQHTDAVFSFLKAAGVRIAPMVPALTAFSIADFPKNVKGVRAAGRLTLLANGDPVAISEGEIQYTEYGISGIAAMQLSSYVNLNDIRSGNVQIAIDSLPDLQYNELRSHFEVLKKRRPDMPVAVFMTGLLPKGLSLAFMREAGADEHTLLREMTRQQEGVLFTCCKAKKYRVNRLRGFENAQVMRGGIAASELTEKLELKKLPGMFACGEMLNINGDCGGYNLQWAWSSGAVAGKNCIGEIG